ncbi:MAG: ABC transporter permease [Spirochaetaceae bacterium]|nr:MAG: ABC transporter permease [Spirochaetaceae bacterium]
MNPNATPSVGKDPTPEDQTVVARRFGLGKRKAKKAGQRVLVASQWELIRWKFSRHKLAVAGLAVLGILYLGALFCEPLSPMDPRQTNASRRLAPPTRIRFRDESGLRITRPFVYGLTQVRDPLTLRFSYVDDETVQYRIRFFVRGAEYRLWGLFRSDLRLFGVEDGGDFFLMGTDTLGRDVFSRILYGSRISLSIGLVGIAISFVLGVLIGGASGYFGGTIDIVIQRVIEFLRGIPTLPLWMGLSVALPPHWPMLRIYFGIVVILSLIGWTGLARVVRGKFMSLREEDFVMAARVHGAGELKVIVKHMLPSFYSHIIASLTLSVPNMILGETALSFIGLGLQSPAISWGVLLQQAQAIRVLANSPWLLAPGFFIIATILAFNFVGDGLRDAADPYATV